MASHGVGHGDGGARAGRAAAHPAAAGDGAHRVQGARRLPARVRQPRGGGRGAEPAQPVALVLAAAVAATAV